MIKKKEKTYTTKEEEQERISGRIRDLVSEFKRRGRMTTRGAVYKPKTLDRALAQASAIAHGSIRLKRKGKC